jgi:N-acetyl-anhydromuramyl-L-alanine amidase AmpD
MEIIDKIFETDLKKEDKKNQILLTHTGRNILDYITSLKYRFNGRPLRSPHYLVTRDGKVIQVLEDYCNSNLSTNDRVNAKSIVVSLENLGWLEKVPLKKHHINWIGNIYKGEIKDKKWRDYFFWQPYTDVQLEKTAELCKEICEKHKIELRCVGHNTKVKGIESYLGIISKSNFDDFATDLSPAFDFEKFNKLLNDE